MNRLELAHRALNATTRLVLLKSLAEKPYRSRKVCAAVHVKQVNEVERGLESALKPLFERQLRSAALALRKLATPDNEKAWKNCGTGSGGFKPGNTCARVGSGSSAEIADRIVATGLAQSANMGGASVSDAQAVFDGLQKSLNVGNHQLYLKSVQIVDRTPAGKDEGGLGYSGGHLYVTKGFLEAVGKNDPEAVRQSLAGTGGERNFGWQDGKNRSESIQLAVAHEVGHHVDTSLFLNMPKAIRDSGATYTESDAVKVSGYASTHQSELFAELHAFKSIGRWDKIPPNLQTIYTETLKTADPDPMFVRKAFSAGLQIKKIREYSCLMLEIPPGLAAKIQRIGKDRISDDALAADGREDWPHITVLYGFHTEKADDVLPELADFGPIRFNLGKITKFDGEDYDVVKIDIESDDLIRMRKIVEQHPHTSTHPGYHPHITLAYVKKGTTGYGGKTELTGQSFAADNLVFSSRNETKTQMRLDGSGTLAKFTKNCGIGPGGFQPGNVCARGGGGSATYAGSVDLGGIEDTKLRTRVEDTLTELHGRYGLKLSKVSLDTMDRDVFDNASAAQMYSFSSSRYRDGKKVEETSHSLVMDRDVWKTIDTLKKYQADLPDGYLADKSAAGMIRHEYAHALDKEHPQYRALINDVYRDYKGKETVSTYSGSSPKEMVAEAFAHYLRQGTLDATGLEKLETVFKGWENGGKSGKGFSDYRSESQLHAGLAGRAGFVADVVVGTAYGAEIYNRSIQNSGNRSAAADAGRYVWGDDQSETLKNCGTGAGGFKPGNTCGRGGLKLLSFGGNTVERGDGSDALCSALFGRRLSDDELSGLGGAPSGSKVQVSVYDAGRSRLYLRIEWKHGDLDAKAIRYVYPGFMGSGPTIGNQSISIEKSGGGAGTQILKHQVDTAAALGVSKINTLAEREERKNGYYTWPRLGYDRELPIYGDDRKKLPESLRSAARISDLMRTEEGRNWWKKYGTPEELTFDLKPGSQSRKVLDDYYNAKFGPATTETPTDGKSAGNDGRGRGDFRRDLEQFDGAKASGLNPESLTDQVFDPDDWDRELINRALPIIARSSCRAAVAQMRVMGVNLRKLKTEKFVKNCGTGAGGFKPGNTCGRSGADQTQSAEFKKWFGDSKVVDEHGRPLVVYHGVSGSDVDFEDKDFMVPAYFTDNKHLASSYGTVREYYLRIENPKRFENNDLLGTSSKKYDGEISDEGIEGVIFLVKNSDQIRSVEQVKRWSSDKSTASEWLEDQDDPDFDFPDTNFDTPYGPVSMKIATEMPVWMRDKIRGHVEETFAQDYWHGMNQTTRDDIRDFLKMSIGEGWSIRDMADKIEGLLGGGDYAGWRAKNIARTESGHALNGARSVSADALMDEMQGYGLPVVKSWLSVLGSTTRATHANLDGVPADRDGLWTLAGIKVRWPGDIRLPPRERCNCQCTIVVDFGVDDEMAQRLIGEYTDRANAKYYLGDIKNCGTGAGGFKPGNTCGRGGGSQIDDSGRNPILKPRTEAEIAAVQKIHQKAKDAFSQYIKTSGQHLTKEQRQHYEQELHKCVDYMTAPMIQRIMSKIGGVSFYKDANELTKALFPSTDTSQFLVGGAWSQETGGRFPGALHLDGGGDSGGGTNLHTRSIYAHELGHALDSGTYSRSTEWAKAWNKEIDQANYPLSKYAATSRSEGFAEFFRLMNTMPKVARTEFPECYAAFRSWGFVS